MNKLLITSLLFLCLPFSLLAQTVLKGQVFDDSGKPLVGATVVSSGIKKGTQTDKDGKFSITLKGNEDASVILSVSNIGFKTKVVTADAKSPVVIKLLRDIISGDDVVVVGYQTLKRKDVLAPVSSVGAAQLKDIPITSASEALNGRLAGVTANVSEGSPDAEVKIRVRGGTSITQDNNPLYIIDGVQVESGLNSLAISDIASIDVLKDATSTAIYGARGANGVVIITTKSGKTGKPRFAYNAFAGFKKLSSELDVLEPYDYVVLQWERTRSLGSTGITDFGDQFGVYNNFDSLQQFKNKRKVNWQDETMGRKALTMSHNFSVNGGNKKFNYNASYSYNKDEGILQNSEFVRNLGNLKLEYRPIKKLKISFSGRYNDQVTKGVSTSNEGGASLNRLRQIVKYRPYLNANETIGELDPDLWAETNGNSLGLINPVVLIRSEDRTKHQVLINGSIAISYNLTKNITLKSSLGYDHKRVTQYLFSDSSTADAQINGAAKPLINMDTTVTKTINNSNVITWTKNNFKKNHDFTVIAGHEIYTVQLENNATRRKLLPAGIKAPQALGYNMLGAVDSGRGYPYRKVANSSLVSFFGKFNYAFKDRYLASFSFRADGSSKFAADNRWGYFPSASIAWRISKEKFFENIKPVTDFKIRAGYGQAGNNRIDDYSFLNLLSYPRPYGLGDNIVNGYYPGSTLSNPQIKWETTLSTNIGFDLTLFKSKIDLSVDLYKNTSNDLLIKIPISSVFGYPYQFQNVGSTENKGVEIQLGATLLTTKNFTWKMNINNSWNKNTVKKLSNNLDTLVGNSGWSTSGFEDFVAIPGKPVGSMYGFITDGFYRGADFITNTAGDVKPGVIKNNLYQITPGSLKLKDLNGDGVITAADRTIIGNPTPKFTGGLNQQFSIFKSFDLSVFVNWRLGGDIMNANKIEFTNTYTPWANALTDVNNRYKTIDAAGNLVTDLVALDSINRFATMWKPLGTNAGNNALIVHSAAIEDGSFLRINNITLGYVLPVRLIKRIGIKNFRIYVTANNLAVITGYTGYDPEVDVRKGSGGGAPTQNVDYAAYPHSRSYIAGINITF